MNMFDLSEWRKQNINDVYHYWQNLVSIHNP
jgi:alpha-1,4-galacturonosyltransferase